MNREGTSLWLAPKHAQRPEQALRASPSTKAQQAAQRAQLESTLMVALWLFIGAIAAYDVYLSIKYQEMLPFQELNPVGRWLMQLDGGSVAVFMGCKFLGTSIVLGVIQQLYMYQRRIGLTVASALAGVQGMLALYLTFG